MGEVASLNEGYAAFATQLQQRKAELQPLLGTTIGVEAFVNTAIIAVKKNPDLLHCDRRSLHNAVAAAAIDGLFPDGKEGVIVPRPEKVKDDNGREAWIQVASWQPMTHGIRKRARELDNIVIDAQVVREKDHFDWDQGDNPSIKHKINHLDDRGPMACVYAIFKRPIDGTDRFIILHREVMLLADVMAVKGISKQPNGVMWKQFEGEAWRKSVIRRGIKSVPSSSKLSTIVERFDDLHTVDADAAPPPVSGDAAAAQLPQPQAGVGRARALLSLKGGKPDGPDRANAEPLPEMTADEKMLADLNREINGGETINVIEQQFAMRIMSSGATAREHAIALIQGARASDRQAAGVG